MRRLRFSLWRGYLGDQAARIEELQSADETNATFSHKNPSISSNSTRFLGSKLAIFPYFWALLPDPETTSLVTLTSSLYASAIRRECVILSTTPNTSPRFVVHRTRHQVHTILRIRRVQRRCYSTNEIVYAGEIVMLAIEGGGRRAGRAEAAPVTRKIGITWNVAPREGLIKP